MNDVQDLLSPGALRGQDGARREDLEVGKEEKNKRNMICCSNPPAYVHCSATLL